MTPWGHERITIISYDVSALFTSIPTEEALKVIKQRLEMDDILEQCSELSIPQLMELMEMCLNTTYIVYKDFFFIKALYVIKIRHTIAFIQHKS